MEDGKDNPGNPRCNLAHISSDIRGRRDGDSSRGSKFQFQSGEKRQRTGAVQDAGATHNAPALKRFMGWIPRKPGIILTP